MVLTKQKNGDIITLTSNVEDYVEGDNMKKFYTKPELEITVLLTEDILNNSLDDETSVDMGNSGIFG